MPISRRRFFSQTGLLAAGAAAAPRIARAADARTARPGQKPRHIIMLVSDGMSLGTLTCADHLAHLLRGRGLAWLQLLNHPAVHNGLMNMRSLDSLVTDSSAASSSWGSGSRIANGAVNVLPDGRELRPLYSVLGDAGWKRALVTTTELTHATPAGFAANDGSRGSAENIAAQYLERKIDVLLGGGNRFYDPAKRKDKRDLWREHAAAGYAVMKSRSELQAAPLEKRWVGTFSDSHLPYTVDQLASPELQASVPTLAEMTGAALKRLEHEAHFIMQVEGGRVDHGCHTCDAAAAFRDQIAFDEALEVCLEFQERVPDTLIVISTDHGNGNPGINGTGANYIASSPLFANLKEVKCSFGEILKLLGKTPTVKDIQKIIHDTTGYAVPVAKAEMFAPFLDKQGQTLYSLMNSPVAQLGQLIANHTAVGWAGNAHTGDYAPVTAVGPGAEHFRGFLQNTDVFHHFLKFAGIDFRNPELPLLGGAPARSGEAEDVASYWQTGPEAWT